MLFHNQIKQRQLFVETNMRSKSKEANFKGYKEILNQIRRIHKKKECKEQNQTFR